MGTPGGHTRSREMYWRAGVRPSKGASRRKVCNRAKVYRGEGDNDGRFGEVPRVLIFILYFGLRKNWSGIVWYFLRARFAIYRIRCIPPAGVESLAAGMACSESRRYPVEN